MSLITEETMDIAEQKSDTYPVAVADNGDEDSDGYVSDENASDDELDEWRQIDAATALEIELKKTKLYSTL